MICNCFRRQSTLTKEEKEERKVSKYIEKQIAAWMKEYRKSIKILLLGTNLCFAVSNTNWILIHLFLFVRSESENDFGKGAAESGKTTIIKQMKILHIKGFSDEERAKKAKEIRVNLLEAIQVSRF